MDAIWTNFLVSFDLDFAAFMAASEIAKLPVLALQTQETTHFLERVREAVVTDRAVVEPDEDVAREPGVALSAPDTRDEVTHAVGAE